VPAKKGDERKPEVKEKRKIGSLPKAPGTELPKR